MSTVIAPFTTVHSPAGHFPKSPPRLSLDGKRILDHTGAEITLKGVSWGHWDSAVEQDAIDHLAQGFNHVRLPLRWWGLYGDGLSGIDARNDSSPSTAYIDPGHLTTLDANINWCTSRGIWVTLFFDSNCGQNGTQDAGTLAFCDPGTVYGASGRNFWTDLSQRALFIEAWKFLVNRYKDYPYIAMWELLPEPSAPTGVASVADVTAFYQQIIDAITPIDYNKTPMLIGAQSGYSANKIADAFINRNIPLIYTADMFMFTQNSNTQAQNITNWQNRFTTITAFRDSANVPLYINQVGVHTGDDPSQVYQTTMLDAMKAQKTAFAWWEYKDTSIDSTQYGLLYLNPINDGSYLTKTVALNLLESYLTPW